MTPRGEEHSTFAKDLLDCRKRLEGLLNGHPEKISEYESIVIRDARIVMSDLLFVEEYLQS